MSKDPLIRYTSEKLPSEQAEKNQKNYQSLQSVLEEAYRQAAEGKGHDRHAKGEPFEQQKICEITRRLMGSPIQSLLYQAVKKIYETTRTDPIPELLGAINYIAAGIIILREMEIEPEPDQSKLFVPYYGGNQCM